MLSRLAVVIVLCLGLTGAEPAPREDSLNNYIDLVFENLQILIIENGLDPTRLPNASTGFSDIVLGVEWHGEAYLYDGWLQGLSSIYRSDNAEFITDSNDIVIGMSAGIGLTDMRGHYTCLAKFMDLGPIADVVMNINGGSMIFEATLDRTTCKFTANKLDVTDIGRITVDITGLGPLNWILEIVVNLAVVIVNGFIENTVETIIFDMVNQVLANLDLGPLGPVVGCIDEGLPVIKQPRAILHK